MSRKRLLAPLLVAAVAVVPVAAAKGGAGSSASAFSPKTLKGSWSGTWKNLTFGTSGAIKASFATPSRGRKLKVTLDFDGSVFGCQDPPAAAITLPKGQGSNKWSAGGFTLKGPSLAFGERTISYSHRTRKVTGKGANPPCAQGLTWTMSGSVSRTYRRLTATVNITLPDGSKAVSELDVKKR